MYFASPKWGFLEHFYHFDGVWGHWDKISEITVILKKSRSVVSHPYFHELKIKPVYLLNFHAHL